MNKVQSHQLNMALEVDRICKKYNINYFIEGGTLLGAVRHKGFIPWDDDLDIDMLREDYDKFIQVAQKEFGNKYFLQTLETEPHYGLAFAKIRENDTLYIEEMSQNVDINAGIYIDIFPIDNVSNHMFLNKLIMKKMVFYRMILLIKQKYNISANTKKNIFILKILKLFSKLFSIKFIKHRIYKIEHLYKNKKTKYVANLFSVYFNKAIIPRDIMTQYIPINFENKTLMGLKEYDKYLTHFYGDYMTPPPKNKRENRHGIIEIKFND